MLDVLLLLSLGVLGLSLIGSGDGGGDDDSDAPETDPEEPIVGTLGDGDDIAVLTDNADTVAGGAGSDLFVGDLTGDRSLSGMVLDFLPGEDAILFDVPGPDLEDAELVIGEPAFSEVYGRSLTEIALTAGGQTYSIFVQTAEEIRPDDIIVRGA
jgi:hypothetical protein